MPVVLCAVWASLCATTVFNNVDDTGLIAWFSHDEIYILDLLQYYRSGQFDPSTFQGFYDYGIYFRYLAGFFELLGRHGLEISPGVAFGVVRLVNLVSGLLAIFAFWRLLVRHFGTGIPSVIALLGLALSPSFVWHLDFAKPEPLVILLMVLGVDYTLRIIDDPTRKHLMVATGLAALAAVIKIFGVFLLPGIVLSTWRKRGYFLDGWKLPAVLLGGLGLAWWLASPAFSAAFIELAGDYAEKYRIARWASNSSEMIGVLWRGPAVLLACCGVGCALASSRVRAGPENLFSQMCIVLLMVGALFVSWLALLGFGWLRFPKSALFVYGSMMTMHQTSGGVEFQSILNVLSSSLWVILRNIARLTGAYLYWPGEWYNNPDVQFSVVSDLLGVGGLLAFGVYLVRECSGIRQTIATGSHHDWKRLTVLVIVGAYITLLLYGNAHPQHFTPAIGLMFLLGGYGVFGFTGGFPERRRVNSWQLVIACVLFATLALNAKTSVEWRLNKLEQRSGSRDLVWEIRRWWKANISPDSVILAGLPHKTYVPNDYKKVIRFADAENFQGRARGEAVRQLKEKIDMLHPQYVVYNLGRGEESEVLPELERLLPARNFVRVQEFKGKHFIQGVSTGDRIVVYRMLF